MFFFVLLMRMVNEIGGQERNYLAKFNFRNYARRQALESEFEYTEHIECLIKKRLTMINVIIITTGKTPITMQQLEEEVAS